MPDTTSLPVPTEAPVLSTPNERIFESSTRHGDALVDHGIRSEEELRTTYEIDRTAREIRAGGWKRVALQLPDHLLRDAPWISKRLSHTLREARRIPGLEKLELNDEEGDPSDKSHERIFILADTSYGACCVDEVAAEHANADVVVHYGRACLSPTARLPAVYCYTRPPLAIENVVQAFKEVFPDRNQQVILMSDLPYDHTLPSVKSGLETLGYKHIFATEVVHDAASALPNRTVPLGVSVDEAKLRDWDLFYVSEPSPSLLLTITSKVRGIHVIPVDQIDQKRPTNAVEMSTRTVLRRRYAMLTSLTTVPIFGIIVNTLSVRDYMGILRHVKDAIAAAGKKSYTFVVGKVNAAKVANFSEVGGWVVIGCWESSLFESKDFWKPMITPFELELALQGDASRVWTGNWTSDFQAVLRGASESKGVPDSSSSHDGQAQVDETTSSSGPIANVAEPTSDAEEESAPPEYDLRTGRYVSNSRPIRHPHESASTNSGRSNPNIDINNALTSQVLTKGAHGDLISTRDATFPAAAYFRDKRSWQGLGSDFEVAYDHDGALVPEEGAVVEQGRSGIARGYRVGKGGATT